MELAEQLRISISRTRLQILNPTEHGGATGVIEWISEVADENCKDKTGNI